MTIEIDHSGTRALVTGAGAGIGAEIARWLARAGATVAVHDVRADKAAEVVAAIDAECGAGHAIAVIADARDDAALEAMVDEAAERLGGLDVAVNNVGMYGAFSPGPFTTLGGDHWRGLLDQNLVITALAGAAEARHMIAGGTGGVILNVSSGETTRPAPFMAAYAAAKAASTTSPRPWPSSWGRRASGSSPSPPAPPSPRRCATPSTTTTSPPWWRPRRCGA